MIWYVSANNRNYKRLPVYFLGFWLVLFGLLPRPSHAAIQDGAVDPTFKSGSGPNAAVRVSVLQSDGKILLGGTFTTYDEQLRRGIVRLNADGSLDSSFNTQGSGAYFYAENGVSAIVLQPDGKILIGGSFINYNGTRRFSIARLNSDGSLDSTFSPNGNGADNSILSMALQSDGKILIGGYFTNYNGTAVKNFARLNADGSFDSTFNTNGTGSSKPVFAIAIQSDNKILIEGYLSSYNGTTVRGIARLNADGSLDSAFNSGGAGSEGSIRVIKSLSDGKILVAGDFSKYNNVARNHFARLNADGSLDSTFVASGFTNPGYSPATITVQKDGKFLIGLLNSSSANDTSNRVIRLNTDGSLDNSFLTTNGANSYVFTILVQSDSKILIGGGFTGYAGATRNNLARLNADGSLDKSFLAANGTDSFVQAIAIQKDGKILVGGNFTTYNNATSKGIVRLNTDGSLDTNFQTTRAKHFPVYAIALQNDGKILIAGSSQTYNGTASGAIARLNSDGSLDSSFNIGTGFNSDITTIAVQSDGKILVGGAFTTFNNQARKNLARLNSDGSLDSSFNSGSGATSFGSPGTVYTLLLQNDGKIFAAGSFDAFNGLERHNIVRLNADGSLDASFLLSEPMTGRVFNSTMQKDGKILIGGNFGLISANTERHGLARLNSNGTLDSSFLPNGGGSNIFVGSIAVQGDGKILIGGGFGYYNDIPRSRLARVNADGSLDSGFGTDTGANEFVNAIVIQSDGKILIGGGFTSIDSSTRGRVARLESKEPTKLTLTANPNPAQAGQSVTFSATVAPTTAAGLVTFSFNGLTTTTAPLVNGVATYMTNTLPAGTYTVTATYAGDANVPSAGSPVYIQHVLPVCGSLLVTSLNDDGQATTCGTLSYALAATTDGTISFELNNGNTITFSSGLAHSLKPGVNIDGGAQGIVLDGNAAAGDGLRLEGSNRLTNLTIRGFVGRELVVSAGSNFSNFYRVKIEN